MLHLFTFQLLAHTSLLLFYHKTSKVFDLEQICHHWEVVKRQISQEDQNCAPKTSYEFIYLFITDTCFIGIIYFNP